MTNMKAAKDDQIGPDKQLERVKAVTKTMIFTP